MADSWAARLGYGPEARLVILHADDVGMCHGSNRAFVELSAAGMVKSGSIMVPCPWTAEILQICRDRPDLDVGVHLTLTCEWPQYRWGPLTTRDPASGLLDADGGFWPTVAQVHAHADPAAAAVELQAQVQRVVDAGVAISHLDSHMGVNWLPTLLAQYAALGQAHRVPVFYPVGEDAVMRRSRVHEPALHAFATAELSSRALPAVDYVRITPCYTANAPAAPAPEVYEAVLAGLEPGITHFALHPNAPGDIEAIDPLNAQWRIFEFEYLQSPRLEQFLRQEGIIPIGYRDLQAALRQGGPETPRQI